jgi:hypothetical protein
MANMYKLDAQGKKIQKPNQTGTSKDDQWKSDGRKTSGKGVSELVRQGARYVRLETMLKDVRTINMCGHSRGSVSCVQLAWMLQGLYELWGKQCPEMNMFLFDPVAGARNGFTDKTEFEGKEYVTWKRRLPSCVTNFRGVLQANITKFKGKDLVFQSTMPLSTNANTNYKVYVMPGGHNAAAKYDSTNGGTVIGAIGLSLAQSFLKENGSRFETEKILSDKQMLEHYSSVVINKTFGSADADGKFLQDNRRMRTTANRRYRVEQNLRVTLGGSTKNVRDHKFFVNKHHMDLMRSFNYKLYDEINRATNFFGKYKKVKNVSLGRWNELDTQGMAVTKDALDALGIGGD